MTAPTGVAWSPAFAAHSTGRPVQRIDGYGPLPDSDWDSGDRVQCLRDILSNTQHALPNLLVVDTFVPAGAADLAIVHSREYLRAHGVGGAAVTDRVASALLGAGAVLDLCQRVWSRELNNGYALVRPAGHHSLPDTEGGGCLFANGVLAAMRARQLGARRVMMIDWDAHHGNSQQSAFWDDPTVLTISVHQARVFAPGTGGVDARGEGTGRGASINVPVPMGSGGGVYRRVFREVIEPAAHRFRPDMVLVASGLDASYQDPSARLALHSGDFRWMTERVMDISHRYAGGRLLMTHEGGYARHFMPLCFLRILEGLSGDDSGVTDPYLAQWGDDFAETVPAEAERTLATCAELARRVPDCGAAASIDTDQGVDRGLATIDSADRARP